MSATNMSPTESPSSAPDDRPSAASPVEPQKPVSRWFIFVFMLTYFAFMLATLMPGMFSLAVKTQLLAPETKAASLGIIVGVGAFVSIVAVPLAGVLSDRTRLRWGRRRPWLVLGIVLGIAGAVGVAFSPNIGMAIATWCVCTLGNACVSAAVNPVIAENIPEAQRGKVGALTGIGTQLAGVMASLGGGLLASNILLLFLAPFAVLIVAAILFVMTVPDRPATVVVGAKTGIRAVFTDLAFNPLKHRDFTLVLIGKFLLQVGMTFFSTYQLYFLLDRLGFTPETAGSQLAIVGGIGILVTTAFAIVSGILSDRWRRRKVFIYIASVLAAAGLITLAFAHDFLTFAAGGLLVLACAGMFGSVDLALVGDTLPDKENAASKWMGLYGVAAAVPSAIAPVFAPLILLVGSPEANNYTMLYVCGAMIALGAAISTKFIRSVR